MIGTEKINRWWYT